MTSTVRRLLAVDAAVNLALGAALFLAPAGTLDVLGLPRTATAFYPTVLGGVVFGIGLALLAEYRLGSTGVHGLGLAGAIAINGCGGAVLLGWLVLGDLQLPLRGRLVLWLVALLVLGIGALELAAGAWRD